MSDDLWAELKSAGAVDSEGALAIDAASALEKLRAWQLAEPAEAVLKLVQSAVAAGATSIDISASRRGLTVTHDGRPPADEMLSDLMLWVFSEPQNPDQRSLRALAVGTNAMLAGGATVSIEILRDDHQSRVSLTQRGSQLERVARRPIGHDMTTRITVKRTAFSPADVERQMRRCRYAPVHLYFQARRVNIREFCPPAKISFWQPVTTAVVAREPGFWVSYHPPEHHAIEVRWPAKRGDAAIALPTVPTASHPYECINHSALSLDPEDSRCDPISTRDQRYVVCKGAIGLTARATTVASVTLVSDGVIVWLEIMKSQGWHAVMVADDLKTDLSQLSLVRNTRLETMLDAIQSRSRIATHLLETRFGGNIGYALTDNPRAVVQERPFVSLMSRLTEQAQDILKNPGRLP